MPTRMTALPLEGGGLALISPVPVTDTIAARVAELGPVRFLVAPNLLHYLYRADAAARWPSARVLAPRALATKRPDLRIDAFLEDGAPPELAASVRVVKIAGAPIVDEHVFLHEPSRTLVLTDLVFHVTTPRGFVANVLLWLVGCHGKLAQSRAWRFFVKDRAAAAASVKELLSWRFDSLIVAHGAPVERDAQSRLAGALAWMAQDAPPAPPRLR
jgi:hypothetical protein